MVYVAISGTLYMARQIYAKDVSFNAYSLTHRESHDGIAYIDIDKVGCCIACSEPLFLAELTRHKEGREDYKKGHRLIKRLAEKAGLNAYIIWFHEENKRVYRVHVRKVSPSYSKIMSCSWEEWISFLASFQVKHYSSCTRKEIFKKKINSLTPAQQKDYAKILHS